MFKDREEAGMLLAEKIKKLMKVPPQRDPARGGKKNMVVVGLTRGGAVVGKVISKVLMLPFDILVVKKIGAPQNPELAIGAVAPNNTVYWNEELVQKLGIKPPFAERLRRGKEKERREQEKIIKAGKAVDIKSKVVIIVDDGIATGATTLAANKYFKKQGALKLVLAVPVISTDTLRDVKRYFDTVIKLRSEKDFMAVGEFYEYFPQVTNEEVVRLIN